MLYVSDYRHIANFYADIAGFEIFHTDSFFIHLETETFQLVILEADKSTIRELNKNIPVPRRDLTPVKLVFFVDNIDEIRDRIIELGGELDSKDVEWVYENHRVCDGQDPEGNVFQLRELIC